MRNTIIWKHGPNNCVISNLIYGESQDIVFLGVLTTLRYLFWISRAIVGDYSQNIVLYVKYEHYPVFSD
jgi:hypothetical protein